MTTPSTSPGFLEDERETDATIADRWHAVGRYQRRRSVVRLAIWALVWAGVSTVLLEGGYTALRAIRPAPDDDTQASYYPAGLKEREFHSQGGWTEFHRNGTVKEQRNEFGEHKTAPPWWWAVDDQPITWTRFPHRWFEIPMVFLGGLLTLGLRRYALRRWPEVIEPLEKPDPRKMTFRRGV